MKFSIGDPVYIKSNNEEGEIDEFIGSDMASVKVNNKLYHAFLDDLEHPYLRWFMKKIPKLKKDEYSCRSADTGEKCWASCRISGWSLFSVYARLFARWI
ncbi:MAG: hypothetical protein IPI46_11215 [Bacteroidetes bacterium]|nr:hypothetical protein [Bacteroidota bacterium]